MRNEITLLLKGKCAKEFIKKVNQPLSPKQLEIFEKADKVFKEIKPK